MHKGYSWEAENGEELPLMQEWLRATLWPDKG